MLQPFRIAHTPATISFSGGRTSGYMLRQIQLANGGEIPDGVRVCFANTGRERHETLDFVRDCGDRWGVAIVWLEYQRANIPADRWKEVSYETAARDGAPFKALLAERQYLPNPVARFCTQELKVNAIRRWEKSVDRAGADQIVGIRADEPRRVAKIRARNATGKEGVDVLLPLVAAGVTKAIVRDFWRAQNFDLHLPNINGTTPAGTCDLCFLKSAATIGGLVRQNPELAAWWVEAEAEAEARASAPSGALFRKDRPSYAQIAASVRDQPGFKFTDDTNLDDCNCTD